MNREIKFRAWIKEQQRMLTPRTIENICRSCSTPLYWGILMQYTGLKDKNGKEIYEGDIVDSNYWGLGKVEFIRGWFWITGLVDVDSPGDELLGNYTSDNIEVVGNIYENPELLEE